MQDRTIFRDVLRRGSIETIRAGESQREQRTAIQSAEHRSRTAANDHPRFAIARDSNHTHEAQTQATALALTEREATINYSARSNTALIDQIIIENQ